jgi:hypothetical protein
MPLPSRSLKSAGGQWTIRDILGHTIIQGKTYVKDL